MNVLKILTLILGNLFLLMGQISDAQVSEMDSLKLVIEKLYNENKIDEIDEVINKNTSLPPEFAYDVLIKNIEILKNNDNNKDLGAAFLSLGKLWARQGNKSKAYEAFLTSESYLRKVNDQKKLGSVLMGQANIIDDYSNKIKKYNESIEQFRLQNDTLNLIRAHLNVGYFYSKQLSENPKITQKEKKSFEKLVLENYEFARITNLTAYPEMEALYNYRLAEWELYKKNYGLVKEHIEKARKLFHSIDLINWEVFSIIIQSVSEYNQNNFKKSISLLEEGKIIAENYTFNEQLSFIYKNLAENYKIIGELDKAYEYMELHNSISLELSDFNNQDKIKSLELEQKILENEIEIENYRKEKNLFIFISATSIFILFLISALLYSLNQNKKRKIANIKKDKIITDIKLKNQELQEELLKEKVKFNQEHLFTFANQMEKINVFLEKLKVVLKKLPVDSTYKENVNALKMSFNEILGDQNQLKQINSLNSEINQEFFLSIRKKFPNLSKSDEQLLSFLIRDMPSKEIAEILKINAESVNKKRYRLRKKLEMENDETFKNLYDQIISEEN